MLEQEMTGPAGNVGVRESPSLSLSKLGEMARQAYEQKRAKDCLDLTRAILLIDPENAEAQIMRSAVRQEMHQDLENARSLLRNAHLKDNPEKHLNVNHPPAGDAIDEDPEAAGSQTLHSESELSAPSAEPAVVGEETFVASAAASGVESDAPAGTVDEPVGIGRRGRLKRAFGRAGVLVFVGLLVVVGLPKLRSKTSPVEVPLAAGASAGSLESRDISQNIPVAATGAEFYDGEEYYDVKDMAALAAAASPLVAAPAPSTSERNSTLKPSAENDQPAAGQVSKLRDRSSVDPVATGTLAVSSPSPVEIYLDDQFLGTSPVSLQVPAGAHTVEYRHGNLRKRLTHVVNGDETTKVAVTFDVTLQVNARPWAEVFLDGVERKPLGQTPLSGVRIPIGSVLVFQNPEFQVKRYRVTGKETGIQIVFP
jgi:hypothetical protein